MKDTELFQIFVPLEGLLSLKEIANEINVTESTIKRWKELKKVPVSYQFDVLKLTKTKIEYSKFTFKEKDQFFTDRSTSESCVKSFYEICKIDDNEYCFIEPSAGNGSFLNFLPTDTIAFDIEPQCDGIIAQDFLEWEPKSSNLKYIVFGNPPFGLRGHMALKFLNHASTFADYVCFILPQLFESDGKGVPKTRVNKELNLIFSEKIDSTFYSPDNKKVRVNCVFQIWSKILKNEKLNKVISKKNEIFDIFSLSDGGTSSSTRNKDKLNQCDLYLPSTLFGKENMRCYKSFNELPNQRGYGIIFKEQSSKEKHIEKFKSIDWTEFAFLSTNSAYNIRSSQIISAFFSN